MDFRIFDNGLQELSGQLELSQQRAFLYGDAHFTTAKIKQGKVEHLNLHIERLQQAHKRLKFNPVLWKKLTSTMEDIALNHELGVIKVQISRGQSIRGYGQTLRTHPAIFISTSALPSDFESNSDTAITLTPANTRLAHQPLLAQIKHCNRLEQVLVAQEMESQGLDDALVCDIDGNIIETNKANIFWYAKGQWFTPSLEKCGVAGVMRTYLLSLKTLDNIEEVTVSFDEFIEQAEAAVICNSLIGIQPVAKLKDKELNLAISHEFKLNVEKGE
jgi:4-amino-4-deoxychorismate lyase